MRQAAKSRRLHWVLLLCAGGALALLAPMSATAITPAQCDARANDTPSKLVECIQKDDLMAHLQKFQDIADANLGPDGHPSRNSGEPGYKASADYVAQVMTDAGYTVSTQTYKFDYYAYAGIPTMSELTPSAHNFVLGVEWGAGKSTGSVTGTVQPAGGIVLPPTQLTSSTSGCTMADFGPSIAGHIALIQRGGCNFGVKVLNAGLAGATGVIIFNEGNLGPPDRTGLLVGSLVDANGNGFIPTMPVAFTTFAVGQDLYNQARTGPAPTVSLSVPAIVTPKADDYNVIAESKGGNPNHVLVVDAHLDAIFGAGILDNATGSAAILDIAQKLKNVNPVNKMRFIWFGGEELGLLGSAAYINSLSSNDLSHIGYDLDADVFGTPNYIIGVLDPAAPDFFSRNVETTFPNRVYKASTISRDQSVAFFDAAGYNHEFLAPNGTDAFSFNVVGIPASGLLTGQDCCKTPDEVNLFGGQTGNYEGNLGTTDGGCVDNPFRWCDNIDNVDPNNLELLSKAFANTVIQMAMDNKVMSSSNNAVYKKKLPIAGEVPRGAEVK
jgi:Peptidase family M28/PA domain